MITAYATLNLPGLPPRNLGTFTGASTRAIVWQVLERWPMLPPACLYLDGKPIPAPKLPGFRDPSTQAKATARLRDPEVQRRKVAARLATEAARRAREAAMPPEERAALTRQRSDRHKARWRKYWQDKADRRDTGKAPHKASR